ncbi:ATPases involved in chromosome partitioning [Renibacterium salmoninarum ATCC 33209]|uniref:ATPases involved in chromosome partitioning n=1 Tax=Renibacterium salmoninarum (strain ATCC 33209 / DSM 20767 / JCM 11484 / NBRC 15589 / NCIMB 2235) TaxID=288705 RepID=A9WPJ6_RENSM|nr:MinD/ParA family protein [Renibacterium salmoninarum]ABY22941.1 ATPases involved in chromosome partitioning [Renibacterium salmoninarum ATCC 33209]
MSGADEFILVEVFLDGQVAVSGRSISPEGQQDAYTAAIAYIGNQAAQRGTRLLAKGIDHTNGDVSWFYVDERGEAYSAFNAAATEPTAVNNAPIDQLPNFDPYPVHPDDDVAETVLRDRPIQQRAEASMAQAFRASATAEAVPTQVTTDIADAVQPLTRRQFVKPPKERPATGIRRAVYTLSGGAVNLGMSVREREEAELERRIARQLPGSYTTAVLSLKGGIGKTSTTVGVGMILAEYRGDPPCAIDANPDSGDLAERALGELLYQPEGSRTISDVIRDIDSITTLTELSRYMHRANRLHLIAGEQDPALSDSLTAEEYLRIRNLISQYYSVILTDCGTGVSHAAMSGILPTATNLIIAAGYAVSGAKRARSTLEWLSSHGYETLARNAVVVITDKDEVSSRVDKHAIDAELAGHCKQLIAVPHDRGVADGDQISLDALRPATRRAYKEIAAAIVGGYV